MSDTVVDSSVIAKWILPEADSVQAQRLVSEVSVKGERLIALDLAITEVANAIWKRHHRGLATLDEARQFLDDLEHSPVHVQPLCMVTFPKSRCCAIGSGRSVDDGALDS